MRPTRGFLLSLSAATVLAGTALGGSVQAETINILMEAVPDTDFVKQLLPEFEEETGITVNIEVVNYAEMHTKLVPQMVSQNGSYSAIVVDFYWVGEFFKAGWMQPLDERIASDGFDTSPYVPAMMDLVGQVDGVTYMLPFYNYAMGLLYRKDMLEDDANKEAFLAEYGFELKKPETWGEYLQQVAFFTKDGMYGVVNQGLRPDPIAMEWSNYLFANGGDYMDGNWVSTLESPESLRALEQYRTNISEYGPLGAASFSFDEAFNVFSQGQAYSYITYNFFRAAVDDPSRSQIVGKGEIMGVPGPTAGEGGSLNGAWGWAIPKSSPNPDAAWKFLQWVESPEIAIKRAVLGGSPTRTDVFDSPDVIAAFPHVTSLKELLLQSHNFPTFTYTPQFVEVLGRELSLAVSDEKEPQAALQQAATEFNDLAVEDGRQQ